MEKIARPVLLASLLLWPMVLSASSGDTDLGQERFRNRPPSPITTSLDDHPEMPEFIVIPSAPYQQTSFVSADRIFTPSNDVDPFFFSGPTTRSIQRVSKQIDEMGCQSWWNSSLDSRPPAYPTLIESLKGAELIIVGTVTGYRQGFLRSQPGTLFRIKIDEVLKGDIKGAERFIFFPIGDFEAGPYRICIESDTYPPLPHLGETLLVQLHAGPDPDLELWPLGAVSFITFQDEKTHLPKFFELPNKHLSSPEHLMIWIRDEFGDAQ